MILDQTAYDDLFFVKITAEHAAKDYEAYEEKRNQFIKLLEDLELPESIEKIFYDDFEAHKLTIITDNFKKEISDDKREMLLLCADCLTMLRNKVNDDIQICIERFLDVNSNNIDDDEDIDEEVLMNFIEDEGLEREDIEVVKIKLPFNIDAKEIENDEEFEEKIITIGYFLTKNIAKALESVLKHPSLSSYYENFIETYDIEE